MGKSFSDKLNIAGILKVLLIVLLFLFLGFGLFIFFKVKGEGNQALREAKNIRMALVSADIEMYSVGKTIYDPSDKYGLADGVKEKVDSVIEPAGVYRILSYDRKNHEITGFIFQNEHYYVVYYKNDEVGGWDVYRLLHIQEHDEVQVIKN